MTHPEPILVSGLFRELDGHLLDLLRTLSPQDWPLPTACSLWSVKDIASHLLDGSLRRLSSQRDGYASAQVFDSYEDLLGYLNRLNADWTGATHRLSPRVLIRLLEVACDEVADLFESVDPFARAHFSVSWAGESESVMWFDVAREFTEHWHHQRQIAEAVGRPTPIDERRLHHPVLDTFLRALPYTYREVQAPEGTLVCVRVAGDAGGDWYVRQEHGGWKLRYHSDGEADAVVSLDQSIAWKLFTKRTDRATARARFPDIRITGDAELGEVVLEMVSIMA
jgi:uncharacterized protein (TIGR03083 family)